MALKPNENAEELSGQFEGDIILNALQKQIIQGIHSKTGLLDESYRWINNTIAYEIDYEVFSDEQVAHIESGLELIQNVTCVTFVERTDEEDYISVIGDSTGCWSYVGRQGGRQELHLQLYAPDTGCFRIGTIVHEFIHALGFFHMQSATERDEYVTIMWDNILPGTESNFNKYGADVVTNFGVEYDYGSVMHYGAYGFAINASLPTIVPIDPTAEIGQRIGMSYDDILRIKHMYDCVIPY